MHQKFGVFTDKLEMVSHESIQTLSQLYLVAYIELCVGKVNSTYFTRLINRIIILHKINTKNTSVRSD
jgi:hypothetical protein